MQDGEIVRMSKRTGKAITLNDLLEDVSIDAARFFFNMRGAGSHLDFDLSLAKEQSNDNPVFYVQYAHARICGILRLLSEEGINVKPYAEIKPELLTDETELDLLKKLSDLPEEIRISAESFGAVKNDALCYGFGFRFPHVSIMPAVLTLRMKTCLTAE